MASESTPQPGLSGADRRRRLLTTPPADLGLAPTRECPQTWGVLTDWNLGEAVASIVALRDGTASLYTSASFGIEGGAAHASVRVAAERAVRLAGRYVGQGEPVDEFPHPEPGQVFFYLLTYNGVRRVVGDEARIAAEADPTLPLFAAAQDVLSELRGIAGDEG